MYWDKVCRLFYIDAFSNNTLSLELCLPLLGMSVVGSCRWQLHGRWLPPGLSISEVPHCEIHSLRLVQPQPPSVRRGLGRAGESSGGCESLKMMKEANAPRSSRVETADQTWRESHQFQEATKESKQ